MKKILSFILLISGSVFLKASCIETAVINAGVNYCTNKADKKVFIDSNIFLLPFSAIQIDDNIHVVIIPVTDSGYIGVKSGDKIKYSISNNLLHIKTKNSMMNNKIITVLIGAKNLNKLILNGNSTATSRGMILCNELEIISNDHSVCALQTDAKKIRAVQMPNSKITINGDYHIERNYVTGCGDIVIEYVTSKHN